MSVITKLLVGDKIRVNGLPNHANDIYGVTSYEHYDQKNGTDTPDKVRRDTPHWLTALYGNVNINLELGDEVLVQGAIYKIGHTPDGTAKFIQQTPMGTIEGLATPPTKEFDFVSCKATDLIRVLANLIAQHGDLPVGGVVLADRKGTDKVHPLVPATQVVDGMLLLCLDDRFLMHEQEGMFL